MTSRNSLLANFEYEYVIAFKIARKYLRRKNVCGVSIGEAYKEGKIKGLAICIHVKEKRPEGLLRKSQLLPKQINGIQVDVIESNQVIKSIPQAERNKRNFQTNNPLVPGILISSMGKSAGTIGMFVRDKLNNGTACILTAAHVLNDPNGSNVYHPGDPIPANLIGVINRGFRNHDCDASIANLEKARSFSNTPFGMNIKITGVRYPNYGDILYKSGRFSGVTTAKVTHLGDHILFTPTGKVSMFGFLLTPIDNDKTKITVEGDSGAIWFDKTSGEGIGINIAGDDLDGVRRAFACELLTAFEKLRIEI